MKVSIIIPTKDKNSRLRLVLQALEPQLNNETEVIIVFDGCSQSTLDEFDKIPFSFSPVKIICKTNIGRAAARNAGIKKARGDIVLFLDDDRIPCTGFVRMHEEGHRQKCVLIGGRMDVLLTENEIGDLFHTGILGRGTAFLESKVLRKKANSGIPVMRGSPLNWLTFFTGNVSVERECLNRAGGFDEDFKGWGHEDIDLGIRLCRLGVCYRREKNAVNYHILHESNFMDKREESLKNLRHMINKYKKDFFLCLVLKAFYIKHKLIGLNECRYLIKKRGS